MCVYVCVYLSRSHIHTQHMLTIKCMIESVPSPKPKFLSTQSLPTAWPTTGVTRAQGPL